MSGPWETTGCLGLRGANQSSCEFDLRLVGSSLLPVPGGRVALHSGPSFLVLSVLSKDERVRADSIFLSRPRACHHVCVPWRFEIFASLLYLVRVGRHRSLCVVASLKLFQLMPNSSLWSVVVSNREESVGGSRES